MSLPKNAITMVGNIDKCWLFAYRVPASQATARVPEPLEAVTLHGFGFLNVVVSELSQMRPLGCPKWLGMSYRHVAYRIPVRFKPADGEPVEGLYFLRSDADSSLMVRFGNLLTDFQFHKCQVEIEESQSRMALTVLSEDAPARATLDSAVEPQLSTGSPFTDLAEAKQFLKYKPAGISVGRSDVSVIRIVRDESAWKSALVHVDEAHFKFLDPFDATLEVCYTVDPICYRWNRAEHYATK